MMNIYYDTHIMTLMWIWRIWIWWSVMFRLFRTYDYFKTQTVWQRFRTTQTAIFYPFCIEEEKKRKILRRGKFRERKISRFRNFFDNSRNLKLSYVSIRKIKFSRSCSILGILEIKKTTNHFGKIHSRNSRENTKHLLYFWNGFLQKATLQCQIRCVCVCVCVWGGGWQRCLLSQLWALVRDY